MRSRSRPKPAAMRPRPKENCETKDVAQVIKTPYMNAYAPT